MTFYEVEKMKSTELTTFENPVLGTLRGYVDKEGKPWFLAGQVCRCLGLKNSSNAINNIITEHNKHRDKIKGIEIIYPLLQTEGGKQKVCVISENILFELVFKSDKDKAFQFRQWVFRDVLPALRKHGEYRMEGKLIRRSLTDTIKTEIADKSENQNEKRFCYSNFSKLINKSLGLPSKVEKDSLDDETLENLARRENLVQAMIAEGKTYGQIRDFLLA